MKANQKQTVLEGNLARLPKFMMPPELIILRELELLETTECLAPHSRRHYIMRQRRRE
jgi:hypothetical protein